MVPRTGKPGSQPPNGNPAAVALARKIAHYDHDRDLQGLATIVPRAVASFYATLDPLERETAKRFRAMVREKRRELTLKDRGNAAAAYASLAQALQAPADEA